MTEGDKLFAHIPTGTRVNIYGSRVSLNKVMRWFFSEDGPSFEHKNEGHLNDIIGRDGYLSGMSGISFTQNRTYFMYPDPSAPVQICARELARYVSTKTRSGKISLNQKGIWTC